MNELDRAVKDALAVRPWLSRPEDRMIFACAYRAGWTERADHDAVIVSREYLADLHARAFRGWQG